MTTAFTGPGRRGMFRVAAMVAGAALLAGCAGQDAIEDDGASSGYVAGDGTIETWALDERGEPVELGGESFHEEPIDIADWRGGPVVVNFWYAECPPCRAEAPDLAQVSQDYADAGVRFLGVNHTNDAGTALAFERRFEVPYPSLHDRDAEGVAAMQGAVPLQAMPSTVVLDQEGRVAARVIGLVEASTLSGLLDDVLAEAP
ncbi:TlpA family protein disulfide reductase [Ruania halotolerans]|uniref:TlpA family protein disulfide reductase n=1 Tax=Ruania halotolerans TaxID=2897773 RepID=UPI001E56C757|nr:TlpA disulfide reductase family protein [Ruania halotolerans]UFU05826.1 TlpA family protein disulfide reductase [Ruania halotolerans]